jgi:putative Mg2+ transporter-C (MgtC) family protein
MNQFLMHLTAWRHAAEHALAVFFQTRDGIMTERLFLALVLCGAIGLERSTHERASGLRTHILVGIGACLMTLAGGYGFIEMRGRFGTDPMRVASYVVSGIGFLGAGAILRHGTAIIGMTTAASLWTAAGIGITVGAGLPFLASAAAALILFTLVPLQRWESRVRIGGRPCDLSIHLQNDREAVGKTLAALTRMHVPVRSATIIPGYGDSAVLRVDLSRTLKPSQTAPVVQKLLTLKYVSRVDINDLRRRTNTYRRDFDDDNGEQESDALQIAEYDSDDDSHGEVAHAEARSGRRRRSPASPIGQ